MQRKLLQQASRRLEVSNLTAVRYTTAAVLSL